MMTLMLACVATLGAAPLPPPLRAAHRAPCKPGAWREHVAPTAGLHPLRKLHLHIHYHHLLLLILPASSSNRCWRLCLHRPWSRRRLVCSHGVPHVCQRRTFWNVRGSMVRLKPQRKLCCRHAGCGCSRLGGWDYLRVDVRMDCNRRQSITAVGACVL